MTILIRTITTRSSIFFLYLKGYLDEPTTPKPKPRKPCNGDKRADCKTVAAMGYCIIPKVEDFMAEYCCETCAEGN